MKGLTTRIGMSDALTGQRSMNDYAIVNSKQNVANSAEREGLYKWRKTA